MGTCTQSTLPTQIVLLGATGDLAKKKLIRSLFDLHVRGTLPRHLHIVAFSRNELTSESYRSFAREHLGPSAQHHQDSVEPFLALFEYVSGTFDDAAAFVRIKDHLNAYDETIGMCTSKLFYLAVPPSFYDVIFERIAHAKLDLPCAEGEGWVRILVEKPFGSDLDHAHRLEDKLSVLFKEEQIYRIDHYLAKDALQNILSFRYSNVLFEDRFNSDHVEAVYLRVFESFDVSTRGAFFDGVGALRDVGQNHMLQMLALIAMEHPETLSPNDLRTARAKVLKALEPPTQGDIGTQIIKGQYDTYRETEHVDPTSKTETYFMLKTAVDTPRWRGVPFYLEHGKAMPESSSEIVVRFRSAKHCVCGEREPHDHPNFLRFTISPEQTISVRFWVRAPGTAYTLESNDLVFDRAHTSTQNGVSISDAYEEVLLNAICGDQTLFVSSAEQAAAWTHITRILELWQDTTPLTYTHGSDGPSSALQQEVQALFPNA